MKKRLILLLLAAVTALSVGACGKEAVVTDRDNPKQSEAEIEKEKGQKEDRNEGSREEAGNGENRQETGEKENAASSLGVRLGGDFDEKYDGFSYLKCETLILKPDEYRGITEEKELKIFLPVGDYASVNENSGYADSRGVDMEVSLAPYLRWDDAAHTLAEELSYHVEMKYDEFYCTDIYDLDMAKTETTENGARSVVKYCYYDRWTDSYIPVYCTYYLTNVVDEKVLVEIEINMMDAADDMEEMLAELEAFYGFDIAWDAKEAQKKLDDFIAAGVLDTRKVSTGYLMFEIPKDWDADYSYSYEINAYAPDGSAAAAGCVVGITHEYMGMEPIDITEILSEQEAIDRYIKDFEESAGYVVEDMQMEYYGSTCMGEAMKFSYKEKDGEIETESVRFLITNDKYFSVVYVTAYPDKFEEALAVAENILANGKMH